MLQSRRLKKKKKRAGPFSVLFNFPRSHGNGGDRPVVYPCRYHHLRQNKHKHFLSRRNHKDIIIPTIFVFFLIWNFLFLSFSNLNPKWSVYFSVTNAKSQLRVLDSHLNLRFCSLCCYGNPIFFFFPNLSLDRHSFLLRVSKLDSPSAPEEI